VRSARGQPHERDSAGSRLASHLHRRPPGLPPPPPPAAQQALPCPPGRALPQLTTARASYASTADRFVRHRSRLPERLRRRERESSTRERKSDQGERGMTGGPRRFFFPDWIATLAPLVQTQVKMAQNSIEGVICPVLKD
jgi:hypothetical protein